VLSHQQEDVDMSAVKPVSILMKLISEAETTFGRKEHHFWIGVGLRNDFANPVTSYFLQATSTMIFVVVGENLLDDLDLLNYQLAHEAVHCLADKPCSTALEEGVATYFGLHNSLLSKKKSLEEEDKLDARRASYLKDVRELLCINSNAVKLLRDKGRKFADIKEGDLTDLGAKSALATRLCAPT
jgi:hypothetical protein